MAYIIIVNPYLPNQIKQDRVMNMGVLAIASAIADNYDVKIVDHYSNPTTPIKEWIDNDTCIVAFSCSGAESYSISLQEARKIKREIPEMKIFMGGQHISGLYQSNILPIEESAVDCFIPGPGEITINKLIYDMKTGSKIPKVVLGEDPKQVYKLDYSLYPDWKNLIPCVEIGRGCNHCCNFCNAQNMRKIAKYVCRDVCDIDEDVKTIIDYYGDEVDIFLFGSIFGENTRQTNSVLTNLLEIAPQARYTFNLRTDCRWEDFIDPLEKLNIRSVFFGMENASMDILSRMNKSRNPQQYLDRAKKIFKKFAEIGAPFFTSFILGYWGENKETIMETRSFIDENKEYLKAIGVNRFYIYPGTYDFNNIHTLAEKYDCNIQYDSDLQLYSIIRQGVFTGDMIDSECQLLEKTYNDPEYYENVRSWRFR